MAKSSNPDFLNGVPELLVLQLVARRAMYGYEIVRAIERSTGESLQFGEPLGLAVVAALAFWLYRVGVNRRAT